MKIAILGGSFNPLHISHAMLADTIIKELHYDKVLFVPTCIPPHKEINGGANPVQRMEMVRAFCNSVSGNIYELEPCEVERGGISYTVDTVKYIIGKYKNSLTGKPALLMGEDTAAEFDKWKNPDEIAKLCDIVIVPRYPDYFGVLKTTYSNQPSGQYEGNYKVKFDKNSFKYDCKVLELPLLPLSSTEIRGRIASGKSFQYLVPSAVYDYIIEKSLYK